MSETWEAKKYGGSFAVFDSTGKRVCYLYGEFEDRGPEENEANANLIAAAPQLLRALRTLIGHARDEEDSRKPGWYSLFLEDVRNAESVAAKAGGAK